MKKILILLFAGLALVSAFSYAIVGGEVVETKVVDAPALALSLAGEIMSFEAEAGGAQMMFDAYSLELAQYDEFLAKNDLSKYPSVEFAVFQARDEVEMRVMEAEGWQAWNEEQAALKQTELNALNAIYTPTKIPFGN